MNNVWITSREALIDLQHISGEQTQAEGKWELFLSPMCRVPGTINKKRSPPEKSSLRERQRLPD